MVTGKDNRLGQAVSSVNLVAMFHQVLQHFVNRILVEEPAIDGRRIDTIWDALRISVFSPIQILPLGLLLLAQRVVINPLPWETQINLLHLGRNQKAILDGQFQFIGIGGDT